MKTENLKYVVGAAVEAQPVYMRFYGHIDEQSTQHFNDEFIWVQDYVKPSKIVLSINSEGGSVLYGMGTFSIIQNCPIEVETIIEGLAASMASVLWAAGKRAYMRDYSVLMIHNPFYTGDEEIDRTTEQTVKAFQKQIEIIYRKRFGLSKASVKEIMEGKDGCDGTYLSASDAVSAGIIPAEHVLKTSQQVCTKVKNQIEGLVEANAIQKIMASINTELGDFKPLVNPHPIHNQNQIENLNSQITMEEKEQGFAFGSVCAQLGLTKESGISAVASRITALMNAETQMKQLQASLNETKIQKEGLEAQLTNVTNDLTAVKSDLQKYKDAEKAQRDSAIEQFIDNAISEGKISSDSKSKWIEMAQGNYETVQAALNSIPSREKISEKIAGDPSNVEAAKTNLKSAERKMAEALEAAVGKDFQFQTLD